MIKALLLDLDGTLLDEDRAWVAGTKAFYEAHGGYLRSETFEEFLQRSREILIRHWPRYVAGELDFEGQRRERVREALGLNLSDAEADAAFAPHREAYHEACSCYEDVSDFMLRTRGLLKIAVTNAHRIPQHAKMERAGLLEHIPDLVTPEDVGAWKPDAKIFRHALSLLGVRADEAMMIGDDYICDIAPAEALGMRTFWVKRGKNGLNDVIL